MLLWIESKGKINFKIAIGQRVCSMQTQRKPTQNDACGINKYYIHRVTLQVESIPLEIRE